MGFKNFLVSVIKSLVVLVIATLIFSTVAFNAPALIKGVFKDMFQYSSPEVQKEVVGKLTSACSSLGGKDLNSLQQEMSKSPVALDFSRIGSLCKDYNEGKIDDRQFFFNVIGSAVPDKFGLPKANALEKYNSMMEILNKNKIIYFAILAVLFVLLYLLVMDIKLFATALSGISFSIGILILLPYAAIMAYGKLVGIDTTPILSSILQGSFSFNIKAIISVVLLMILRTYSSLAITLGILFFGIGIAGKIYSWKLKKKKNKETKTKKKPEKEIKEEKTIKEKQSKEDADEAYKHRDRSAKEILEELEEMHRKKMKGKEN